MKATKLLFTLLMFILPALAYSEQASGTNEIPVSGKTEISKGPSRVPAAPAVEATQTGDLINIYFLNDLGNVTITIPSETRETVYQHTAPTGYGASELIDTSDFAEGSYLITFTNATGLFLHGEFQI